MDQHALRDYDYVEWNGRSNSHFVATPAGAPPPFVIDTTRISLFSEREMRYWTSELGVTVYTLRDAIESTGTRDATVVRAWLECHQA